MNDGIRPLLSEDLLQKGIVSNITFNDRDRATRNLRNPVRHVALTIAEIVEQYGVMPGVHQRNCGVGPYEAAAASQQDAHFTSLSPPRTRGRL
jgi:hypothetical protein